MRTVLLAVAAIAAAPLGARAEPIPEDFLTVRYEGLVTEVSRYDYVVPDHPTFEAVDNFEGYRPGHKIVGTLLVDFLLAPPDANPSTGAGRYALTEHSRGPSFVSGAVAAHGTSFDSVQVGDSGLGDLFDITDAEHKLGSGGQYDVLTESILTFRVAGASRFDFTEGDGLFQDFDLERDELAAIRDESGLAGGELQIQHFIENGARIIGNKVTFLLTKLSAKPGRCSI